MLHSALVYIALISLHNLTADFMHVAGTPQAQSRSLAASSASLMRRTSSACINASAAAVGVPGVLVRSAASVVLEPKQALTAALSWTCWQPIPLQVRHIG